MSSEIELLPCPFCGSQAKLTIYSGSPAIFCDRIKDGCEALMGGEEYEGTENYLVACWNKRAAPVVDRQPFFYGIMQPDGKPHYSELCVSGEASDLESEAESMSEDGDGEYHVVLLYTAPPELAELQATIARLTAENERLKGWQGEPVAWLTQCQHSRLVEQSEPDDKSDHPEDWSDSFPVYRHAAVQPTLLLMEAYECGDRNIFGTDLDDRIRACLDKVKELNQ
jgi:hypothetical protein